MTLEGVTWIVVVNGIVQLVGLVILILGQRDIARILERIEAVGTGTFLEVRKVLSQSR